MSEHNHDSEVLTLRDFLHFVDNNTFTLNNERFYGKYADYDADTWVPVTPEQLVAYYYESR